VAFLTVAVWGSTFVFTKLLLLSGLTAAQIFTLRFIIAYVSLMVFSLSRKSHRWMADTWRDELLMVGLGLAGGSLYFLTENEAMNYTTTTNTSLIVCLCPLFATALIGAVYKTERLRPSQLLGTLLAAIGVIVVVLNGHFVLHLSPLGDSLAFAACLCWAVYSLLMIPANRRYDVVFITRKVFFYGILTVLPMFLFNPWQFPLERFQQPAVWMNLIFLSVVASFLCFLWWSVAVKKIGALRTSNYVYLNPITTVIASALFLNEPMTAMAYAGSMLILLGVYLANRKTLE
jgi:drug/metabolite transporter (DMT)-like permease